MFFFRRLASLIVIAALSACSAVPTVEYKKITSPDQLDQDASDNYAFQRSVIRIDAKKDAKGAAMSPLEVVVSSVPIEHNDFKIAIRHANKLGVKTIFNIVKVENTDLIKEIGTEVIDTRVDVITKVGGILVKLAPLAFSATEGLQANAMPLSINTQLLMQDKGVTAAASTEVSGGNGVLIDFGPIPKDARPIAELPEARPVSAIYYAACRTAVVKVALKDSRFVQSVKISDPRYFQSIGLPLKGKVTMHSECGASAVAEKDSVKSGVDIAEALLVQGKAIKDAIDAAKKEDGEKKSDTTKKDGK